MSDTADLDPAAASAPVFAKASGSHLDSILKIPVVGPGFSRLGVHADLPIS